MIDSATPGRLVVLAAPSGAGKTSLVHALLSRLPNLKFSVSYTTRPQRSSETSGEDYIFVTDEEFQHMLEEQAFLEHARVFDHWYGTSREQIETQLEAGFDVLLEIDWQGARQVRERVPDALSVFILPPSVAELALRLRARGTDSEATIARRLRDALSDMEHWSEFDCALINDELEVAAGELASIVAGASEPHRTTLPDLKAQIEGIIATGHY